MGTYSSFLSHHSGFVALGYTCLIVDFCWNESLPLLKCRDTFFLLLFLVSALLLASIDAIFFISGLCKLNQLLSFGHKTVVQQVQVAFKKTFIIFCGMKKKN